MNLKKKLASLRRKLAEIAICDFNSCEAQIVKTCQAQPSSAQPMISMSMISIIAKLSCIAQLRPSSCSAELEKHYCSTQA